MNARMGTTDGECDLVAMRNQPPADGHCTHEELWIEAKWWWRGNSLEPILRMDRAKLETIQPPARALAIVFTVDEVGAEQGSLRWTEHDAEEWLNHSLEHEHLTETWQLLGCATAPSRYFGIAFGKTDVSARDGVFVAAFFEYLGRTPTIPQPGKAVKVAR